MGKRRKLRSKGKKKEAKKKEDIRKEGKEGREGCWKGRKGDERKVG
jgi:hypothetical protein